MYVQKFQGLRIVFSGTLEQLGRKHAEVRAKQFGCFVGTDVSKNTDILIIGDEPGKKKEKAEKLGNYCELRVLEICCMWCVLVDYLFPLTILVHVHTCRCIMYMFMIVCVLTNGL